MSDLFDQAERDQFRLEHARNISVVASAGSGKTRAIVERIVALAQGNPEAAAERLSRLVVVTYSVAAAQEMQQRARAQLALERQLAPVVLRGFQRTFFGTIHSYCVRLLERFGHQLGLAGAMRLAPDDDDELWNRFLVHGVHLDPAAGERELFAFIPPRQLYGLGRRIAPGKVEAMPPLPALDLTPVLAFDLAGVDGRSRAAVRQAIERLAQWDERRRGGRFQAPPVGYSGKAADFVAAWDGVFAPWHEWIRRAALGFGRRVANAFETFRLAEGALTYDDQVRFARRLLDLPAVRAELAAEKISVLLDEAQDTDRRQFDLLLRVAGLRGDGPQAEGQTFSTVGDFQQAIWAPRSDLTFYQGVHEEIGSLVRGRTGRLSVTFRCDRAVIDFVNAIFRPLLDGSPGQASFVDLQPRPDAGPGQVVRWSCPLPESREDGGLLTPAEFAEHEARQLAQKIATLGPAGLSASAWREVAILAPRNDWLEQIAEELDNLHVPVQLLAGGQRLDRSTVRVWLTSLLWIAVHPEDDFEIAGVLREILGVTDDAMARFCGGEGSRLRLMPIPRAPGPVGEALALLAHACEAVEALPVHQAVRQLIERTRLRERLVVVGEKEIDRELDDLRAVMGERAAAGAALGEIAEEFRDALSQAPTVDEESRDAVQLLSFHKAKGLQWPTVIIPFLHRPIGIRTPSYPRLEVIEDGREVVYRDKSDYAAGARAFVERRDRQQLQRLLYVACTRSQRALIFVDDEAAAAMTKPRKAALGTAAQALDLRAAAETWSALPSELSLPAPEPVSSRESFEPALTWPDPATEAAALDRAQAIPRRETPHSLARPVHDEAEPEITAAREEEDPAPDNPGIRYGTWWHEMIQAVPWTEPRAAWEAVFAREERDCPQPERARAEWDLFLASGLAVWLAAPGRIVHAEFPFLWPENADRLLEGIIDLAVWSPETASWRVIDWKTNRMPRGGSDVLREIYAGQITAYVRALRGMLGAPVTGSLYLTATGETLDLPG